MNEYQATSTNPFTLEMRSTRERDAVLKLRVAQLRSGNPDVSIFAFEGGDDKIVYSRWIERVRAGLVYEPFVCDGKRNVRKLRNVLARDRGSLAMGVYYFVDRDFDGLNGFSSRDNVFVTEMYSVENYLVAPDVIASILRDEFPCHERPAVRAHIVEAFCHSYDDFLAAAAGMNLRLFVARRTEIACAAIKTKASHIADVEVGRSLDRGVDPRAHIVLEREPTAAEEAALTPEFDTLHPAQHYRGKFAWSFIKIWLERLCYDYARTGEWFADVDRSTKVRSNELTLGSLAAKSAVPNGLQEFLLPIA